MPAPSGPLVGVLGAVDPLGFLRQGRGPVHVARLCNLDRRGRLRRWRLRDRCGRCCDACRRVTAGNGVDAPRRATPLSPEVEVRILALAVNTGHALLLEGGQEKGPGVCTADIRELPESLKVQAGLVCAAGIRVIDTFRAARSSVPRPRIHA